MNSYGGNSSSGSSLGLPVNRRKFLHIRMHGGKKRKERERQHLGAKTRAKLNNL